MTDLPISHSESTDSIGKIAEVIARMIALFRTACGALAQAPAGNAERKAMRRTPEDILTVLTHREEARRAVDRLLR